MLVNHLNTFPYGGAATAALRLHRQMLVDGVDSRFLYANDDRATVAQPHSRQIEWATEKPPSNFLTRNFAKRRIRKIYSLYDQHIAGRDPSLELVSMASLAERTRMLPADQVGSILHLHWLAFMVDYGSFFGSIASNVPIVWTLHDMNPFTGGCHYSNDCERFAQGCGHCPLVQIPSKRDVTQHSFQTKKTALKNKNLTVVGPSRWILDLARNSPVFPETTAFQHIRLGFDLQTLRPLDKTEARQQLGIDTHKVLIGFGCESVDNPRKGLDLLVSALAALPKKSHVECVVFGAGELDTQNLPLPKMHQLGFIDGHEKLAQFYSACDFVVLPSREDNQPQVGLEAMACGTPVVGFNIGGVGEFVRPGITGWLARKEDALDLAVQMAKLIDDADSRQKMGHQCRQMMQQDFDIIKQSRKYQDLYRDLLGNRSRQVA